MIHQETGAADAAHHQLSGGKRSRKSACPKRILQQQQHHQQQLLILEAKQNATVAYPETKVGCYWEDGVEEKRSRWEAPSACPQTSPQMAPQSAKPLTPTAAPVPAPLQLPLLPAGAKDDGGADLLRSLGTFSPQSLIPSLYAALGGRGGGGRAGGSGGGDSGGYFGFGGELEAAPQRGWPKTVIASATDSAPVKKCQQQPQQPQPQPQQQPHQQRRGPRPYDPQSKPEPVRIITRKGVAYNRRPRSFYSADVKLAVIEFAEQHGASAAERHFNVPLSTVQSWMRHDNKARIMRQSPQQIVALGNAQQPALQPPPPPPPPPPQPQPLNLTFPKPSSRR